MGDFNTREAAHYIINQVLYYYENTLFIYQDLWSRLP
jgi:hypothetical protein